MIKQIWSRYAAMVLAGLTGLAIGLLLPGAFRLAASYQTEAEKGQETVAAFAQQDFFISTAQPEKAQAVSPAEELEMSTMETATASAQATAAPDAAAFSIRLLSSAPVESLGSILIYHTHTYEAYEQTSPAYQETEKWRTADESCNMIRVGEELAGLLRSLGYHVVHDTTAFEPPDLSSAYTRSLAMLEKRGEAGERYDLYIDLHRDAYVEGQAGENTVSIGGVEAAKLMLLIGKGEGYTGSGYDRKPDWESNLHMAQQITDALNSQAEGLCKEVRLKSGRFNQHVANGCVLIEAGNNRNTLEQVLASMPYLADAIHQTLCP